MKFSTTFLATALAAVGAFAQQNGITILSLTGVTVCQPILISWTGGTPPYYLSILPAGQPNAPALVSFPKTNANSLTWNVNLGYGSAGFLNLRDSNGAIGQSATFTVLNGSDTSCLTQSLSVSSGPEPTGSGSSASGSGSASTPSITKTSTSSTTKSTSTSDAAARSQFGIGAAAVIGAIALVLA